MAIKYYNSDGGVFAVIADSAVLSALQENFRPSPNSPQIVTREGAVTSAGELFFNLVPVSSIPVTIFTRAGITQSPEAYNYVASFFPILTRSEITVQDGTTVTEIFETEQEGKTIRATFKAYSWPEWGGVDNVFICASGESRTTYGYAPYGCTITPRYSDTATMCFFGILIANDDMTTFASLAIHSYYNSGITAGLYDVSPVSNTVEFFNGLPTTYIDEDVPDPYEPAGDSEEGGGDGDFTDETEDIDFPVEPTLSAADTKFITLYNPSKAQLDNLASYMWSTGFDLDTFKKLFADPMQCILGLSIVPVNVPSGGTRTVTVGNISTGISMTVASKQYVTVDCGSINVKKYWGAYLDYDPYTKAEIYLPYIGIHSIAVDDIMGKSVHVLYRVDILSGACTAFVKCGGSVLYQFTGACASSIPVTGNDWTNVINGALTIAGSIGTMAATGGATAPMAVGAIASACTNSLKPNIEKSGSMGGTGGLMGGQKPYLILTRPVQAKPKNQNKYLGYPSFITSKAKNLKGFTIFESIRLSNIPATEQEIEELSNLLESGVIL